MSHHFAFLDDSAAREQERQILASTPAEFAPIPRAPEIDDGRDLGEDQERTWPDGGDEFYERLYAGVGVPR